MITNYSNTVEDYQKEYSIKAGHLSI